MYTESCSKEEHGHGICFSYWWMITKVKPLEIHTTSNTAYLSEMVLSRISTLLKYFNSAKSYLLIPWGCGEWCVIGMVNCQGSPKSACLVEHRNLGCWKGITLGSTWHSFRFKVVQDLYQYGVDRYDPLSHARRCKASWNCTCLGSRIGVLSWSSPFLQSQVSAVLNASFSGGANFPTVTVWRCYQEFNVWHNHIIEGFYIFESMKALTHFVCHFMEQAISIHESIAPFYDTIKQTGHFFPW